MLFVTVAATIHQRQAGPDGKRPRFIAELAFGSGNTEFQVGDSTGQVHR
jgi:hypothetical protein